jgi:hypothetical protein
MMQKEWFLSERGVWVTAAVLTLIALLENSLLPWSPFYVVYALLALALPLWLGSYRFGPIRAVKWWHWPAGIVAAILFQLVGPSFLRGWYHFFLARCWAIPFMTLPPPCRRCGKRPPRAMLSSWPYCGPIIPGWRQWPGYFSPSFLAWA